MGCFGVLSITLISNVCWALRGSQRIYSALLNFDTTDTRLMQSGPFSRLFIGLWAQHYSASDAISMTLGARVHIAGPQTKNPIDPGSWNDIER